MSLNRHGERLEVRNREFERRVAEARAILEPLLAQHGGAVVDEALWRERFGERRWRAPEALAGKRSEPEDRGRGGSNP